MNTGSALLWYQISCCCQNLELETFDNTKSTMLRSISWLKGLRSIRTSAPIRMTFEGNTQGVAGSDEERMKSVFGGRLKGQPPKSTSRFLTSSQSREIAGVRVPSRPQEPDNCCMSGCVNCVWELYNDDLKEWKNKRREAIKSITGTNEQWPADFSPPLKDLHMENVPKSLRKKKLKLDQMKKQPAASFFPKRTSPLPLSVIEAKKRHAQKKHIEEESLGSDDGEGWEQVPIFFKVFAEFEKKKKSGNRQSLTNKSA